MTFFYANKMWGVSWVAQDLAKRVYDIHLVDIDGFREIDALDLPQRAYLELFERVDTAAQKRLYEKLL